MANQEFVPNNNPWALQILLDKFLREIIYLEDTILTRPELLKEMKLLLAKYGMNLNQRDCEIAEKDCGDEGTGEEEIGLY